MPIWVHPILIRCFITSRYPGTGTRLRWVQYPPLLKAGLKIKRQTIYRGAHFNTLSQGPFYFKTNYLAREFYKHWCVKNTLLNNTAANHFLTLHVPLVLFPVVLLSDFVHF